MKKLYIILALAFFATTVSYSQLYEKFNAKDAYNYVKNENVLTDMKLGAIMAMEINEMGMDMLQVDSPEGVATNWTFVAVSNDPNNKTLYSFLVLKMAGQFIMILDSNTEDFEDMGKYLNEASWVNSDLIGTNFKKTGSHYQTYLDKKENIYGEYLMCMYFEETGLISDFVWIISVAYQDETGGACMFNASTGENILCEFDVNAITEYKKMIANHFPNPSTGIINFETELSGKVLVQIFDMNGGIVKSDQLEVQNDFQFNVSDLSNGVYNVMITSENGSFSKKIVIAK